MRQFQLIIGVFVIGDDVIENDRPVKDDERQLVERAKSDPQAFGLLFDRYHDRIYKYIVHRTANPELARDLTSETFYRALNKLWTFRWRNVPFSAWLYRIATNEVNGYYRRHKNYDSIPLDEIIENSGAEYQHLKEEIKEAEDEINRNQLFLELQQAVSRLKNKYQEVIVLRYFEGKQVKEVAEILNKSEGTVKSLLHRALKQLQDIIDTAQDVHEEEGRQ